MNDGRPIEEYQSCRRRAVGFPGCISSLATAIKRAQARLPSCGGPMLPTRVSGLGDVGCCGFFGGLGGSFGDAEIAFGPFVQDVEAPGAGPRRATAEEIFPDGLRESAVEAGFESGRPIA